MFHIDYILLDDWQPQESLWAKALYNVEEVLKKYYTLKSYYVCVKLSNDKEITYLNKIYRGKDMPTNVLSFPLMQELIINEYEQIVLGDVILSYDTLVREAQDQKKILLHHFQHLILHGILHLLGYDHKIETEAERMEKLEIELLQQLKIPSPYKTSLKQDLK